VLADAGAFRVELAEKPLGYQSAQGDPGNKGVFSKALFRHVRTRFAGPPQAPRNALDAGTQANFGRLLLR
jgi:hypothetical protein